jgi:membrane-associated phospholipid phosphatase
MTTLYLRRALATICLALPLLAADLNDSGAGSWRYILLNSPTQVLVAEPTPVNDAAYQAELAAIKAAQSRLTQEQRDNIEYWSKGGIIRWTEIMLELVARYNLPPAPRDDGSYVFPDASNPFADPQFPFANPPYAARAYAYASVAQYEALKAAWYYKYLYNRPMPSRVDSGIQALRPSTDLPSYPSEDAVMSGAATTILQLLFPAAIEEINQKAAAQREAALLSGRATSSDISAGLALGNAVAALVVGRARTDGMGAAIGNATIWQQLADQTAARGEIPWKSLESPPRPPMLPLFGRVLPWMLTTADIVAERPAAPPSTASTQMAQEVAEVRRFADNLTRKQLAIALKWSDGAGTPTPPGRWNLIALPWVITAGFSEVRAARTFALLNMSMHDSAVACWDAKYAYFNPRPSQLDPRIKTSIGLPNFPAYVSGHSTFSASAAAVLSHLFPAGRAAFESDRDEASISRLYGAIHYRSDVEVGKSLGNRIAGYTILFAQTDGSNQ